MAGYIGSKAVLLSTTAAVVTGDADIGGGLTVDTNTLFVDAASNNVGIGTSSPSNTLDIRKDSPAITQTSSSAAYYTTIGTNVDFTKSFVINNKGSEILTYADDTAFGLQLSGGAANLVRFSTNSTERMRIDSSGNVGIGTTSFAYASAGRTVLGINNSSSSLIEFQSAATSRGYIIGDTNGIKVASAGATPLLLETNGSERMRIDSSGNLLLGTTSAVDGGILSVKKTGGGSVIGAQVGVNSNYVLAVANQSGSIVGGVIANASTTSYATSSDYRLKENVVPLAGAADRLAQIPVHRFNFIADPNTVVDGFLAHEVQAFVPEAVTGEKDAVETVEIKDEDGNVIGTEERPVYQGIDQSKLVPLLTAALQEALTKIDALEARIVTLEGGAA